MDTTSGAGHPSDPTSTSIPPMELFRHSYNQQPQPQPQQPMSSSMGSDLSHMNMNASLGRNNIGQTSRLPPLSSFIGGAADLGSMSNPSSFMRRPLSANSDGRAGFDGSIDLDSPYPSNQSSQQGFDKDVRSFRDLPPPPSRTYSNNDPLQQQQFSTSQQLPQQNVNRSSDINAPSGSSQAALPSSSNQQQRRYSLGANDNASDDTPNNPGNATGSDDSIQTTKANLSRHVTSVITHFTATKDGYRRLVNELEDFLHVVSPSGTILYAAPSAAKHLGISSAAELEGTHISDYLHPDDRQLVIGLINHSTVDRAEYSAYCRFKRTNGEYVVMDLKGKPFPEDPSDGNVKFVVHAAREYRSKGTLSIDSILELRLENLRLRRKLEECLLLRGVDPKAHPILRQDFTEPAPSAHPYDLDVGGNLESTISEEDFADEPGSAATRVPPGGGFGGVGFTSGMGMGIGSGLAGSLGGDAAGGSLGGGGGDGWAGAGQKGNALDKTGGAASPSRTGAEGQIAAGVRRPNDDDGAAKATKRKKVKVPVEELFCRQCGTTASPEWRKGPLGPKTLCNACGLAYSKKLQKEKKRLQKMAGGGDGGDGGGAGGGSSGKSGKGKGKAAVASDDEGDD
ncbi:blue light receptor [Blyttiomyces sp. JEL0837]|nr:blue light receptor [Blyttiomyces sp. JEL0837]